MSEAKSDLRKACEAAAGQCWDSLDSPKGKTETFETIIERHMTPVFERMRDTVIEECAALCDVRAEKWLKDCKLKLEISHGAEASVCAREIRFLKGVRL